MTHPHKELIIKLLDDPTLEVEVFHDGKWKITTIGDVAMYTSYKYRLREKPKPEIKLIVQVILNADGTLKNAEVIQ